MTLGIRHKTAVALVWVLLILCVAACGGTAQPSPNVEATVQARLVEERAAEATVEARIHTAAKAIVEATAQTIRTPTAIPTPPPINTRLSNLPLAVPDSEKQLHLAIASVPPDYPDYDRKSWRHWLDSDGDCQDARQETLIAESTESVTFKSAEQCQVVSGTWIGPYTDTLVHSPSDLDVDHMVPLANAHRSGGWAWSRDRKSEYANDLDYANHLIAATASANRSKGSDGPEDWRPPERGYWCEYALDWIVIKNRWGLTATQPEWNALRDMLDTCGENVEVSLTYIDGGAIATSLKPAPTAPIPTPTPSPLSASTVRSTRIIVSDDSLWAAHPASESVIGLNLPGGNRMWQTSIGCEATTLTRLYSRLFVTCFDTGELVVLNVRSGEVLKKRWVGHGAFGVIENASRLYISLSHEESVIVLDAETLDETTRAQTGYQPRGLALKGNRLYVVHLFDASVRVFDAVTLGVLGNISIGLQAALAESVTLDPNKARAYVAHQRQHVTNMARLFDNTVFPIVSVLDTEQQRPIRREALALDSIDTPVSMPAATVLSEDGKRLYVVNAASDDLSVINLDQGMGVGHVLVGHNPRDLALARGGDRLYTLNMVSDNVSVIDTATLSVLNTFELAEDPRDHAIQQGERIFRTSRPDEIARDNWLACASCHFDGGSDGQTWLGTEGGARNTPVLRGIAGTSPLHWSGDRPNVQSFQQTVTGLMSGTGLSRSELDALAVYLNNLQPIPSPLRKSDRTLPDAAIKGATVFQQAGCAVCHSSPRFTDRQAHDVGTGEPFHDDPSGKGQKVAETMGTSFDTPSLRELWLTAPYLHDGRAMTLGDVLVAFNNNDKHGTTAHLSGTELFALEAFLLTLPLTPKEFSELRGK